MVSKLKTRVLTVQVQVPSPKDMDLSRTHVHCQTRVLHHWWIVLLVFLVSKLAARQQLSLQGKCQSRVILLPLPPTPSVWPHLFRGVGHEKRRESSWSGTAFRLYIGSFPCAQLPEPVHTAQFGLVFFCVFNLGLCFVCSFVLFDLFVCPHSFTFPWAVESSPLRFLALA